jgi:hypothetical protein
LGRGNLVGHLLQLGINPLLLAEHVLSSLCEALLLRKEQCHVSLAAHLFLTQTGEPIKEPVLIAHNWSRKRHLPNIVVCLGWSVISAENLVVGIESAAKSKEELLVCRVFLQIPLQTEAHLLGVFISLVVALLYELAGQLLEVLIAWWVRARFESHFGQSWYKKFARSDLFEKLNRVDARLLSGHELPIGNQRLVKLGLIFDVLLRHLQTDAIPALLLFLELFDHMVYICCFV